MWPSYSTIEKTSASRNMVTLFCAIVGVKGSVFSVDIDASQSVDHLKNAIAERNKFDFAVNKLELYLAKRGDTWLTENEVKDINDISGLKHLSATRARLHRIGLSDDQVVEKFDEIEEAAGNGPVNVLVVVREGADGLPTKTIEKSSNDSFGARDNSDDWLAKRIEYHSLPSIASLPKFIEHSLPVKIRMNPKVLSVWSSFPGGLGTNVREKLFAVDDVKSCEKIRRKIENMLEPLRSGDTEKSFIWFWDTMIRALLDLMFVNARLNRDTNHQSSTAKQRADFMFFLNEQIPRLELSEKLIWSYGIIPYLFGYAASGYKIQFFAMVRAGDGLTNVDTIRIGSFDLKEIADRFRMVLALLNLCLLFPAITEACPNSGRNEYTNIHCSSGVLVRLNPTSVEKVFLLEEGIDQLELIYRIIKNADVPHVDRLIKVKRSTKTATFEPCGMMVKPSNLLELFVALRFVLEAMIVLHRELVIHRDIRWSNVIKRRDCDAWFLIDFADAAISPQHFPNGEHLSKEEHAPEIFVSGGTHTTAVDLWGVGYLIETSFVNWDDLSQRTAFVKRLMMKDPNARPTAEQALSDLVELQAGAMQEQLVVDSLRQKQIQVCNESKRKIENEKRMRISKRNKNRR
ncbi:putative protein kinase [Plasmopara halstedii]